MLAHIRRAVSRTTKRRKPAPPAPPLKSPATKLAFDIDDAVTKLAKAVKAYATSPDDIPATIRADYAAGIALGAFVELIVGVQAAIDPNPDVLLQVREERVLDNLIVNYGLQALLSNAANLAELRGEPPQLAVYERAADLAACVHDSAHLALLGE